MTDAEKDAEIERLRKLVGDLVATQLKSGSPLHGATLEAVQMNLDARLARHGVTRCQLQSKWRNPQTLGTTFGYDEVTTAVLDALINVGFVPAWDGDGLSCVVQIIQAVWDRPRKGTR